MIGGSLVVSYERRDGTRIFYVIGISLPDGFDYLDILERVRNVDRLTELRLLDRTAATVWQFEGVALRHAAAERLHN